MADCTNITCLPLTAAKRRKAFSLIETGTVLTITAMLVLAALGIYNRVRASAAAINQTLDKHLLATEVLHRIAEDLDRLVAPGSGTTISIVNKLDASGYNITRLIIENSVYGDNNKPRTFEKITWQTYYDLFEGFLILYRCHDGLNPEDSVLTDDLEAERQKAGTSLFIPLCTGITFFKIQAPVVNNLAQEIMQRQNNNAPGRQQDSGKFIDRWTDKTLPNAVTVTISFAQPYETVTGRLDVPEDEKISRTIAIDRTRKIPYRFIERDFTPPDVNDIDLLQFVSVDDMQDEPDETENLNEDEGNEN
jgi:hypothetical protein